METFVNNNLPGWQPSWIKPSWIWTFVILRIPVNGIHEGLYVQGTELRAEVTVPYDARRAALEGRIPEEAMEWKRHGYVSKLIGNLFWMQNKNKINENKNGNKNKNGSKMRIEIRIEIKEQ